MSDCTTLQDRALEDGAKGARATPELREHLAGCAECQRFLEDLEELNGALQSLPAVDAPDDLLERTARRVRVAGAPRSDPARRRRRTQYWYSAAAGVAVTGLAVLLLQPQYRQSSTAPETALSGAPQGPLLDRLQSPGAVAEYARRQASGEKRAEPLAQLRESERLLGKLSELPDGPGAGSGAPGVAGRFLQGADALARGGEDALAGERRANRLLRERNAQERDARTGSPAARAPSDALRNTQHPAGREQAARRDGDRQAGLERLPASPPPAADEEQEDHRKNEAAALSSTAQKVAPAETAAQTERPRAREEKGFSEADRPESAQRAARRPAPGDPTPPGSAGDSPSEGGAAQARASARAERFLADLERVEGLSFKAAEGYWRNTYVPGDSSMRLLRTRLGLWRQVPQIGDVRLEEAVRANRQPLDVPDNAAMGLYLQADKAAVDGMERVRLQVGLQGALRQGARPTMNLSVLLDLSSGSTVSVQQTRAIVDALLGAHQPGDRFSLSVAGEDGGLLVDAGDFRHGPLQVALTRLYGGETPADAQRVALGDALRIAAQAARSGDDPSAVFGSSLVLMITTGITDAQLPALQAIAHRNALNGIALSVVDAGAGGVLGTGSAALERLVAAGQGQRRALARADDAPRVIDAEVHAASRAVARAARLRIRLASGVRLVDVLGSERLEEPQAERVREAEQRIDRRLARNLGIRADRGEDEDGIQIVIPNFYAGDSHVILLDVLVDGPGAVADVTLRYKDLVHLKNGVARAELRLPGGERSPGPLQRNVLKNRVAFELAQAARQASRLLEQGAAARAIDTLRSMHDLLAGLRESVGGWSRDRELLADARALADYVDYLQANLQAHPFHQRYLVESLRYMAFRKLTATNGESP